MFPYRDENPSRALPIAVWIFCLANAAAALYGLLAEPSYEGWLLQWGLRPADFWAWRSRGPIQPWMSLAASPWLHGGLLHLLGNLWFLWIFGDNVEDQLGHPRFVIFYLSCGFLATLTHLLAAPESTVPLVGASGAIAGVLGAYMRFFPRHRVRTLVVLIFLVYFVRVPAGLFIGLWLAAQVAGQYAWTHAHGGAGLGGIAFAAHLGGFAAGFLLAGPFSAGRPPPRRAPPPEPDF